MMQGPNVKKLIAHRMSSILIPAGTENALAVAIKGMTKPGNLVAVAREATVWVEDAISAVKAAPDNTYGNDDEAIAGECLRRIDEQIRQRRTGK